MSRSRLHPLLRATPLALAAVMAASAGAAAPVTGTVRVEFATIRIDGPKHDRDVVIMLEPAGKATTPMATAHVTMDQKGLVFIPHVLAVQKGSTVRFLNNDNDQHNVYLLVDETGRTQDIGTYGPGVSVDHRFADPGTVIVLCKLHLEMAAYIVVSDSPWFTTAQLDPVTRKASFSLLNVPAGEYRVTVWHKELRAKEGSIRVVVPSRGAADIQVVLTTKSRAAKGR
jgi:plastocyanin